MLIEKGGGRGLRSNWFTDKSAETTRRVWNMLRVSTWWGGPGCGMVLVHLGLYEYRFE